MHLNSLLPLVTRTLYFRRLVILVELGTHLITDALISPYRIGERVRAIKLLRSVESRMLLTWDRGLHSFKMVEAALAQKCQHLAIPNRGHILGRIPKNVKFPPVKELADGSYLSWINPDRTLASRFNGS